MKKFWRKMTTSMLAMVFASTSFLNATQLQAQPVTTRDARLVEQSEAEALQRKIVGYFPSWAYKDPVQGNFMVTDLQWDDLTHIQYSFAGVDPKTNKIYLLSEADEYAATKEDFSAYGPLMHEGKEVNLDPTLPYKGHFNLMQVMKKQYPDVKVVISVGGWAASTGFYTMMDTDAGINTFADSCVDFIRKYGLDGVDIDFEYPSATSTSGNPTDQHLAEPRRKTINARYNKMMKTLREKLDKASLEDGKYYSLSAAVAASAWVLGGVTDSEYAQYLDFLSVMSYDFHGAWNGYVGNLANIYMDSNDPETEGQIRDYLAMEWAYDYYRGVLPPEKILMGIPYYTRGHEKVKKQPGAATGLHGTAAKTLITERGWGADKECNVWGDDDDGNGSIDASGANPLWHVLNLMDANSNYVEYWDDNGKVPYIWNEERATFLSYENERSIAERVKFIDEKNLGGALIWVMNGDYDLNPNYDPNYDPETADRNDPSFDPANLNKGKYTFGDTLTEALRAGMDRIGPAQKTTNPWDTLATIDVEVDMDVKYDHPNGTYTFTIVNKTGEKIPGGWTIEFDFPKSADFASCWGGTFKQTPNGEFNHITLSGGGWNSLDPGAKIQVQGMTKLCYSGIQNLTFNGLKPINWATGNEGPVVEKPLAATLATETPVTETGDYAVNASIPANSKATSYTLYENNVAIKNGVVDPKAATAMTFTESFAKKPVGKYSYRLDLTNDKATTPSNALNVEVKKAGVLLTASISSSTPTTDTGVYDLTVNIPANSNALRYNVLENGTSIKTGTVDPKAANVTSFVINVVDKPIGKYTYTVQLTNDNPNTAENSTMSQAVVVEVVAPQPDVVLAASVSTSVASTDTGAYDVNVTIPANSKATSYTLYENGKSVKTGTVNPKATTAQKEKLAVTGKEVGKYTYKVELTNGVMTTQSNEASVEVMEKQPDVVLTASVNTSVASTDTGAYDVNVTIPANSKATSYTLYENGKSVKTGAVTPNATTAQKEKLAVTGKTVGTYTYKVELTNGAMTTTSNEASVVVEEKKPSGVKPAAPSVSHNNWDGRDSYDISFNMWWGENGNQWKLYENDKEIHAASLTPNGTQAQSGAYKVEKRDAGTYKYKVELINEAGKAVSNEVSVEVKGTSGGGGGEPPVVTEKPAAPAAAHDNWDNDGNYNITFNMWWGVNGTEWKLYENGTLIHTAALTANGNSAQSGSQSFNAKAPGTYTYKVELINEAGATTSNEVTVTVK
ncbi:MAG: glycosyl hydrolase family 18 protein [Cellulosilyticaceae bacterium]